MSTACAYVTIEKDPVYCVCGMSGESHKDVSITIRKPYNTKSNKKYLVYDGKIGYH